MTKLLFLGADDGGGVQEEAAAAHMAAESIEGLSLRVIAPSDLVSAVSTGESSLLWWHRSDPPDAMLVERLRPGIDALRAAGGKLFLSLGACAAVHALGLDDREPDIVAEEFTDEYAPEFSKLGLAGFGPHPLFEGIPGWGNYLWSPRAHEPYWVVAYGNGLEVGRRRVIAVEKSFLRTDSEKVLLWEYDGEEGQLLCCGAHLRFGPSARPNRYRVNCQKFLENALAYLDGDSAGQRNWWNVARSHRVTGSVDLLELPAPIAPEKPPTHTTDPGLELEGIATARTDFVVAGERVFAVGRDLGSIQEVWVHPNRVIHDLRCDLIPADGKALDFEGETERVRHAPWVCERRGIREDAPWSQILAVDAEDAWFGLDLTMMEGPGRLRIGFLVDFRRQWPFPERCWGPIELRSSADGRAYTLGVEKEGEAFTLALCSLGDGVPPDWSFEREGAGLRAIAEGDRSLRLSFWAGPVGSSEALEALRAATERQGPDGESWWAVARRTQSRCESAKVRLEAPDSLLRDGFAWARASLGTFAGVTPELGRGILGGYASTRPGWGDARPGYAWFFGRDTAWSVLGLLASGQVDLARDGLAFMARQQAPDGKLPHEVTTSGAVQDDAADATPLWISAMAEYLRWTGDLEFLGEHREALERALRFCDSTVANRDGWIENRGVGHGWVEFGVLGEARVSLYLSSVWIAALRGAAYIARCFEGLAEEGEEAFGGGSERLSDRADGLLQLLERRFAWSGRGSLYYGLDGDLDPVPIETVMPAIPAWLEQVKPSSIQGFLDVLAGPSFSTDWGVRLLPAHDRHYNPRGYHTGAVWPLFSGWAALAEYAQHRPLAAFQHAASLGAGHALPPYGLFEEALAADSWASIGVCRHHVWSAAMASASIMAGLLGARDVDVPNARLSLEPHVPPQWEALDVEGIRLGDRRLDLTMRRRGPVATWTFRLEGEAMDCTFRPGFTGARSVERVVVDGQEQDLVLQPHGDCLHCELALHLEGETRVSITLGPLLAPALKAELPVPGECSTHVKWIRWREADGVWSGRAAGRSGSTLRIPLCCLAMDPSTLVVHGDDLRIEVDGEGPCLHVDFPGDSEGWVTRSLRITEGPRDLPPEESEQGSVPY